MKLPETSRIYLKELLVVLGGMLLICGPALYNGFPLMYSDSGAYMAAGFEGRLPLGRPMAYGWFISFTSLHLSLWLTIFAQSFILAYLIRRVLLLVAGFWRANLLYFGSISVLVLCSGLGWYGGQLMPDIFVAALPLAIFLFIADNKATLFHRILWAALVYLFCVTHYSHTLLDIALLGLMGLAMMVRYRKHRNWAVPPTRFLWPLVPAFLALLTFCLVNSSNGWGFRLTRSSHVFTMGKMVASGMLEDYLKETCETRPNVLCPYADELPNSAAKFIWSDRSPFKKTGYWKNSREPYNAILSDMLSRPKYILRYIWEGLKAGTQQLLQVDVGEGLSRYRKTSAPHKFFDRSWKAQLPAYLRSRQIAHGLDFEMINTANYLLFGFSVVFLFWIMGWRKDYISRERRFLITMVAMAFFLNAFLTGIFANVYSRLQGRVAWLIPLCALVVMWELYREKRADGANEDVA
ncbi:MAG: hypothetical protein AAF570_00590 [Bacteroidota bacterium]